MNQEKLWKFAKGAGIAIVGAVAAYVSSAVVPDLEAAGLATIAALASMVANGVKLWLSKVEK